MFSNHKPVEGLKKDIIDTQEEMPVLVRESSLQRIRALALGNPDMVFTAVVHRIDLDMLGKSFKAIRRSKASGVDKKTARDFAVNLDENLYNLYQRLRRGQYVAQPVKRVWIDKGVNKKRPIGIPALEDKIVQKAAETILSAIFEVNFHDFSYGFRKGYSAHMALKAIWQNCQTLNINWVLDADIAGFFDNIDRKLLIEFIKRRVNDGGMIRLIGKWLNAGVVEGDVLSYPEQGTPQGGVISPVLANIFLHYVLDDWFVKEVKPRMEGRCFLIRYADDFVIGFESERDAKRVMEILPKRFARYKLTVHPDKTKMVDFRKPGKRKRRGLFERTFDFLGFTHYWGKSRKGRYVVKRKTAGKRMRRFTRTIWEWCRKNRHLPLSEQYHVLSQKLRGYNQYYGIIGNFDVLKTVRWRTKRMWRYWLSRRSHKGHVSWEKFEKSILSKYVLPCPRIVHNV
jgi:RNA-directed DNA polymerase